MDLLASTGILGPGNYFNLSAGFALEQTETRAGSAQRQLHLQVSGPLRHGRRGGRGAGPLTWAAPGPPRCG
jgi:hypothetical protein